MNTRETTASKIVTNYYYSLQCTYFNRIDWSLSHAFFIVKILHSKFGWRSLYTESFTNLKAINLYAFIIESNRNSNASKIDTKFCKLFVERNSFWSYFTWYILFKYNYFIMWIPNNWLQFFYWKCTLFSMPILYIEYWLYILHPYHVWYL